MKTTFLLPLLPALLFATEARAQMPPALPPPVSAPPMAPPPHSDGAMGGWGGRAMPPPGQGSFGGGGGNGFGLGPLGPIGPSAPSQMAEEFHARHVSVAVDASREDVVLERRVALKETGGAYAFLPIRTHEATWEPVCISPCRVTLDKFGTYRVAPENGVTGSRTFTLPQIAPNGGAESIRLHVEAGNLYKHRAGQALGGAGGAAIIVGVALLATAHTFAHPQDARLAGYITGGAGILTVIIGATLAFSSRTHVTEDTGRELGRAAAEPQVKVTKNVALTERGLVF